MEMDVQKNVKKKTIVAETIDIEEKQMEIIQTYDTVSTDVMKTKEKRIVNVVTETYETKRCVMEIFVIDVI